MKDKIVVTDKIIEEYLRHLESEERSRLTISKYERDIRRFSEYLKGRKITKSLVIEYKENLRKDYLPTSVNSMLSSVNGFFAYLTLPELRVKRVAIQKKVYCDKDQELTKGEYKRLLCASKKKGQERINLIIQTICGTGIRVSELAYITIEAARRGRAIVECKGKVRTVFISATLQRLLLSYASTHGIEGGSVFITRSGKPCDRSNIWRDMKTLCDAAGVDPQKVFPHNLRHLFARSFYDLEKDIAKLADILGHSSIDTTRIYILSCGSDHSRQVDRLDLVS